MDRAYEKRKFSANEPAKGDEISIVIKPIPKEARKEHETDPSVVEGELRDIIGKQGRRIEELTTRIENLEQMLGIEAAQNLYKELKQAESEQKWRSVVEIGNQFLIDYPFLNRVQVEEKVKRAQQILQIADGIVIKPKEKGSKEPLSEVIKDKLLDMGRKIFQAASGQDWKRVIELYDMYTPFVDHDKYSIPEEVITSLATSAHLYDKAKQNL